MNVVHICKDNINRNIRFINGKEGKGWYMGNIKICFCPYCEKDLTKEVGD